PPRDRARRYAEGAGRAPALSVAAARRGARPDPGSRRAVAAFSQPPGLCALDLVPRLRPSPAMPELHRLAGRAPLYRTAPVPSLRLRRAGAGALPGMPYPRDPGAVRARGRVAEGGH